MPWNEREDTRKLREAGKRWVEEIGFWLWATCQYVDGSLVSDRRCIRDAQYFFNMLDREVLCRELIREGIRLPRLVFLETGKSRENTHFHYFIMGYEWEQYSSIRDVSKYFWESSILQARDCVVQDNMSSRDNRSGYPWKELQKRDDKVLMTECCYLPSVT